LDQRGHHYTPVPVVAKCSGGIAFAFFAAVMLVQFLLALFVFPETKGRLLEEIQAKPWNFLTYEQMRALRGYLREQLATQGICPCKPRSRELSSIITIVALVNEAAACRSRPDQPNSVADLA
jgi:hypothetical protein